ncbi:endonuclease/exonuclease/phosphatase family protein [Pseudomarimonas arenosa]|uniref:Endonuclease/exonuclease/phosphatase family protein n=1 Tax=Pseudomarimonas arenosa TaxID=2774145 RepID=A0AAW3ZRV2_9GAMM|nr:endonuclease/exonuclease/phosphatase family protein [Pseudomarimonas arenosa]MBD8527799.1 endonuclease/exonuclease/phosphatase family protein [Pseudomarimonas arenosa]
MFRSPLCALLIALSMAADGAPLAEESMTVAAEAPTTVRVATFNTSLNDDRGQLIERLRHGHNEARRVAAVIQRVRPDVLLLNEFDFDQEQQAAELFQRRYLEVGQFGEQPIHYAYRFTDEVNTGVASGLDINGDGKVEGPNDAWGFGFHPGQFGMLVLSRYPLDSAQLRSFRKFLWHRLPDAHRPMQPDSDPPRPFHDERTWRQLRLSSKSHWDLPVDTPVGRIHLLLSHPTPPVFDGKEDLNGLRNRDELGFWRHYLDSDQAQPWLVDDQGRRGPLSADARFIVMGDLNNDPGDGSGYSAAIEALLQHPRTARFDAPQSLGGEESARLSRLKPGDTPARTHTASFGSLAGNLRVDFVIPSAEFTVLNAGVFWPTTAEPEHQWLSATDHRMVWVDLSVKDASSEEN